jgi:hypothetical protein
MPADLRTFIQSVNPDETVLFFGAGSSIPSHAPSTARIIEHLSREFRQPSEGYSLPEITDLIEQKTKDRRRMIDAVRSLFIGIRPTGGLSNIPIYDWKAIYTTNYDELIETSYNHMNKRLLVYS